MVQLSHLLSSPLPLRHPSSYALKYVDLLRVNYEMGPDLF
ncbi:unnamed protein product [Spirodela intermedia]|uniref:Uncharacterized protein n=1 Tax=Spirodela intermedia TaxID=51605 RepID=A0A7I8JMB7_SPIIN|nr:unnamed protein product [Spirodela intermedia]CAA6671308.1 unnamed protein product [Spirodela intermedia]